MLTAIDSHCQCFGFFTFYHLLLLLVSCIPDFVESPLYCCTMLIWVFKHQQSLFSGLEMTQFLLVWVFHVGSALVLSQIAVLTSCRIWTPSATSSVLRHSWAVGNSFVLWEMSGAQSWFILSSPPPPISRCSRYSPTTKLLFWPNNREMVLISDWKQTGRKKKHQNHQIVWFIFFSLFLPL